MQLIFLNEQVQYANEISSIDACFTYINQLLHNSDCVLSHLEIDGVEVYLDHHDYVAERIADIKVIELKVRTFNQLLNETLIDLEQYLIRSIPEANQLADEFYRGPGKETWEKLGQLLEGLQWVLQALQPMYTLRNNELPYGNSMEYSIMADALTEQFQYLEKALNHSDMVLTADLLKYEIVELLRKLENEINITIDSEVVRNDLN